MIKLFRNIRQHLIQENKMGKYFKYAIGEIILVVIGILIALQINNWNEGRKAQNSKTQYYAQLLEEIKLDIIGINGQLERLESAIRSYNTYEAIYETPNITLDTIYKNIKMLPSNYDLASFNTKTIEVLKSTGDIKLFPNKIQTLLVTLESLQGSYKTIMNANYGMYLNSVNETYLMNDLSIQRKLANQELLAKALDFKDKLPEQLVKQHLAFSAKNYADKNALFSLNNILEILNELKLIIEIELEN